MADNYLERRMDDYRSGRLAKPSRGTRSLPADAMILRYPPLRILIVAPGPDAMLEALLGQMRGVGFRVAFSCPASPQAVALGQKFGARFYPSGSFGVDRCLDDLKERWGGTDHILSSVPSAPAGAMVVAENGLPCREIARLLVFLLHPDNHALISSGLFSEIFTCNPVENT